MPWNQASVEIKNSHEDKGVLNAETFQRDIKKKCQSQLFLVSERSYCCFSCSSFLCPHVWVVCQNHEVAVFQPQTLNATYQFSVAYA